MHVAQKLKARGKLVGARGERIVVLDKTGVGAGASGIACGVVRNNYFQPAMQELMADGLPKQAWAAVLREASAFDVWQPLHAPAIA